MSIWSTEKEKRQLSEYKFDDFISDCVSIIYNLNRQEIVFSTLEASCRYIKKKHLPQEPSQ